MAYDALKTAVYYCQNYVSVRGTDNVVYHQKFNGWKWSERAKVPGGPWAAPLE